MRRIAEVVSELTPRGAPTPARILIVAAKAAGAAGRGYDVVIEVDEHADGARARTRAASEGAWSPLTEAWLAGVLTPYAGRQRLVRVNSWPLLSRLVLTWRLAFGAAELLVVQAPPAPDDASGAQAGEAVGKLLRSLGFRIAGLALPADESKRDVVLAVAARAEPAPKPDGDRSPVPAGPAAFEVVDRDVAFADGYATGRFRLSAEPGDRMFVSALAGDSPVAIAEAQPEPGDPRAFSFRLWAAPEMMAATGQSLTVAAFAAPRPVAVASLARPAARRFVPDAILKSHMDGLAGCAPREPFGVLVIGGSRPEPLRITLDNLAAQGAANVTHVWLDGDPANPANQSRIATNAEAARRTAVREVRALGGRIGPDKLMIHALDVMTRRYDAVLVLDDGCVPARGAVAAIRDGLGETRGDPSVLSVYGQPFGFERGAGRFGRFQSRGWAAHADHLAPLLPKLAYLYSLEEADFLAWAAERLTDEVRAAIDVTPGDQPSETLSRRFDWRTALCLIASLEGLSHAPAARRVILDCGPAEGSPHDPARLREPPFNLVDADDLEALAR